MRRPALAQSATVLAWVTDLLTFGMFACLVAPDLRLTPSGINYAIGYPRLIEVLGLAVMGVATFEALRGSRRLQFTTVHYLCFLFIPLAFVFGEGFLSPVGRAAVNGTFRSGVLIPLLLFVAVSQLRFDDRRVARILVMFVAVQIAIGIVLICQEHGLFSGRSYYADKVGTLRVFGFGYNVAHTAYGLALGIVIAVGMLWRERTVLTILQVASVPILLFAALATLTRTAVVGLAATPVVYIYGRRHLVRKILAITAVAAVVVFVTLYFMDKSLARVADISFAYRLSVWYDALRIGLTHPLGTGTAGYFNPACNGQVEVVAHPQNDLLFIFATHGWLATIVVLLLYYQVFLIVFRTRKLRFEYSRRWFYVFAGILLIWLAFGMTEICFSVFFFNGPFFYFLAVCYGYCQAEYYVASPAYGVVA